MTAREQAAGTPRTSGRQTVPVVTFRNGAARVRAYVEGGCVAERFVNDTLGWCIEDEDFVSEGMAECESDYALWMAAPDLSAALDAERAAHAKTRTLLEEKHAAWAATVEAYGRERALSAELAAACERALAFVESMPDADNVELTPALRAALAKARGERGGN